MVRWGRGLGEGGGKQQKQEKYGPLPRSRGEDAASDMTLPGLLTLDHYGGARRIQPAAGKQVVNAELKSCGAVLLLAFGVLTAIATLRGAEYDEQYTLFLTAGVARPVWPQAVFAAGEVRALQAGHASLIAIARDLRTTDVHPPLYFWAVALWRRLVGSGLVGSGLVGSGLFGSGLLAARLLSVVCGVAALAAVGVVARRTGVPAVPAMLLTSAVTDSPIPAPSPEASRWRRR